MAYRVNVNQDPGGKIQVVCDGTGSGAISVNAFSNGSFNEITTELVITKIISTGACDIVRGANTVFDTPNPVKLDLDRLGMPLTLDSTQDVTINQAAGDTTIVEFKRKSTFDSTY